jgi:hypothetical protein
LHRHCEQAERPAGFLNGFVDNHQPAGRLIIFGKIAKWKTQSNSQKDMNETAGPHSRDLTSNHLLD